MEPRERYVSRRDKNFVAGLLVALLGIFFAAIGQSYSVGTLREMGSGYLPVVFGILLVLLGIAIAVAGTAGAPDEAPAAPLLPDLRGAGCILAGLAAFIVLGESFGLVPAAFACVFIAALGDRESTMLSSLALAAAVTTFGVVMFYYLLQIQLPLFRW